MQACPGLLPAFHHKGILHGGRTRGRGTQPIACREGHACVHVLHGPVPPADLLLIILPIPLAAKRYDVVARMDRSQLPVGNSRGAAGPSGVYCGC